MFVFIDDRRERDKPLSWYPSGTWRLEADYGWSFLVRGGITGYTHGLSGRIQWRLAGE
jgi:hypothetical protein